MALVLKDRISETTTTTGTGSLTLAGATPGFQAFSVIGNGNTTYYCIVNDAAWEVGLGTYASSGNTLARTTVYATSSGTTSPITLTAGTKNVFATLPADGIITVSGSTIQVPGSGVLPVANGGTGSATASFSGANITSINASAISTGTVATARLATSGTADNTTFLRGDQTWAVVTSGLTVSNDTSTASDLYPSFANVTTGTITTTFTSNTKLLYKPSTGELKATVPVASNGIFVNANTVTSNYTVGSGYNGLSAGPVTVDTGVNVTVADGSVWTVV